MKSRDSYEQRFIDAVKQSKKKMIVDIHGNGSGITGMGFELLFILFLQSDYTTQPNAVPMRHFNTIGR